MRIVAEYLRKAVEFDEWARASSEPILKETCADPADCYEKHLRRWLATEVNK
jgi:hypothetical protein